jgi:hypothetical protein
MYDQQEENTTSQYLPWPRTLTILWKCKVQKQK